MYWIWMRFIICSKLSRSLSFFFVKSMWMLWSTSIHLNTPLVVCMYKHSNSIHFLSFPLHIHVLWIQCKIKWILHEQLTEMNCCAYLFSCRSHQPRFQNYVNSNQLHSIFDPLMKTSQKLRNFFISCSRFSTEIGLYGYLLNSSRSTQGQ